MHDTDATQHAIPNDTSRQDATVVTPSAASHDASSELPAILQVDAARRAGVSVRTIQRAIDRGDLAATRDGVHCWVRLDDLDRWQLQRTTRSATARVVARDNDAPHDATSDAPRGATNDIAPDATLRGNSPRGDSDPEVARLQGEVADLKVERDRWHQAFERESALREEETRQLRQLIQQEQALSFSRFAAIEATTRHDTIDSGVSRGRDVDADVSEVPTSNVNPSAPNWRRWWRRVTGHE